MLHCDEWDRIVDLPRYKFVTGATLLQLVITNKLSLLELLLGLFDLKKNKKQTFDWLDIYPPNFSRKAAIRPIIPIDQ